MKGYFALSVAGVEKIEKFEKIVGNNDGEDGANGVDGKRVIPKCRGYSEPTG
jgi:hypothetical protein